MAAAHCPRSGLQPQPVAAGAGFALETDPGLAWNPLAWRPLPVVLTTPNNLEANGLGRMIDPALSMSAAAMADVRLGLRHYLPAELERLQPDTWVMQQPTNEAQLETLRRSARFTRALKVADVSVADLRADLQVGGGMLRRFIGLADRLVVPTEALSDTLRSAGRTFVWYQTGCIPLAGAPWLTRETRMPARA